MLSIREFVLIIFDPLTPIQELRETRRITVTLSKTKSDLESSRAAFEKELTDKMDEMLTSNSPVNIPNLVAQFKEGFQDEYNRRAFTNNLDRYLRSSQVSLFMLPVLMF